MKPSAQDVQDLCHKIFDECIQTLEAGQKEYAHDATNALANFERVGEQLGIPREKVWFVYAGKHWAGIQAWINGYHSQREDVRGRIKDLIVYSVLLWAMVESYDKEVPVAASSMAWQQIGLRKEPL